MAINYGDTITAFTTLDMTGKQLHCVNLVSGSLTVSGLGDVPYGILYNTPNSPKDAARVMREGGARALLGGTCSVGQLLGPDANGVLIPDLNGRITADEDGIAGDIIDVFLNTAEAVAMSPGGGGADIRYGTTTVLDATTSVSATDRFHISSGLLASAQFVGDGAGGWVYESQGGTPTIERDSTDTTNWPISAADQQLIGARLPADDAIEFKFDVIDPDVPSATAAVGIKGFALPVGVARVYANTVGTTETLAQAHLERTISLMSSDAYRVTLQADLISQVATIPVTQYGLYNGPQNNQAQVRMWVATGDITYLTVCLDTIDAFHAEADVVVARVLTINEPGPAATAANGYSAPHETYGAEQATYQAWNGAPQLWCMQWAASVLEVADVVLNSAASTPIKDQATAAMDWVARHILERMQSSVYGGLYANIGYFAELAVENATGGETGDVWSDKMWLVTTCELHLDYWWGVLVRTLPLFMTLERTGADAGILFQDKTNILKNFVGDWSDPNTLMAVNGNAKANGITIETGFARWYPSGSYDVAHAHRVPQLVLTALHLGVADADAALETKLLEVAAALEVNMLTFLEQIGTVVESTDKIDGTDYDPKQFIGLMSAWWCCFAVGNPTIRERLRIFIDQVYEGPSGPGWSQTVANHSDQQNLANISAWLALADKIAAEGGTTAFQRAKVFNNWV